MKYRHSINQWAKQDSSLENVQYPKVQTKGRYEVGAGSSVALHFLPLFHKTNTTIIDYDGTAYGTRFHSCISSFKCKTIIPMAYIHSRMFGLINLSKRYSRVNSKLTKILNSTENIQHNLLESSTSTT
jgi:hypothetical protein